LEREIAETESAVSKCQTAFADPAIQRDAGRGRRLQGEHDALVAKLKALEAEYYVRDV
jgi:hypothetical protein